MISRSFVNIVALCFGLVFGGVLAVVLGGCAAVPAASYVDAWGMPVAAEELCDFGILRGTSAMRCVDEFKRKAWF